MELVMTKQEQALLSVTEVAERLNEIPRTVTRWCIAGNVFPNAYKSNPHARQSPWRIPEGDVEAFERARGTRQ